MSDSQKPVVAVGTVLKTGKVVAIAKDSVTIETPRGVKKFSLPEVERMI